MSRADRPPPEAPQPGTRPGAPRDPGPPWLVREKVVVPERIAGYYDRPALMARILPAARRGTVLIAPGGFGKTTLLAECFRRTRAAGDLAAWLTLDVQDAPALLEGYVVRAFQEAGLDVRAPDGDAPIGGPVDSLLRAVAAHPGPCLLVLDELERIADPDSLAVVGALLKWGPANLSVALACRELPAALDVGSSVLAGDAALFDAGDLRFSDAESRDFLGDGLSRRQLDALVRESAGWPIALRIARNEVASPAPGGAATDVAANWIESRLWRGLRADDREFLLDVGTFERIDRDLLDEVLAIRGAADRLLAMPATKGLLESVRVDGVDAWRLHPVVREHCDGRRRRQTPERYRELHRRIAAALVRRGETLAAMRHAARGGEPGTAAAILEDAGAMRLWMGEGIGRLQAACRLLGPEAFAGRPRLALARCVVEITTGGLGAARRTHRAVADAPPAPDSPGRADYLVDECLVRGMLCLYGCEPVGSALFAATVRDYERMAADAACGPQMRGAFELGLCTAHNLKAEFAAASRWADRAEGRFPAGTYGRMMVELYRGQIAMAQGRAAAAGELYRRAFRIARSRHLLDPGQAVFVEAMVRELDLETFLGARLDRAPLGIPATLYKVGTPLASCAAASACSVQLTMLRKGPDAAVDAARDVLEHARAADLPAMVRLGAGLLVHGLAAAGRAGEADEAWDRDGLPRDDAFCLDLGAQSWREMESVACARLRLHAAAGRFQAGRRLAGSLDAVAARRGLQRTRMRGLALAVALEHAAGEPTRAAAHLAAFLRLYAGNGYALGAVAERAAVLATLDDLPGGDAGPDDRARAEALRGLLGGVGAAPPGDARLSPREMEVLEHVAVMADREVAAALGITVPGVRYHVAKIFAKLGVRDRRSAVAEARRAGLLPGA